MPDLRRPRVLRGVVEGHLCSGQCREFARRDIVTQPLLVSVSLVLGRLLPGNLPLRHLVALIKLCVTLIVRLGHPDGSRQHRSPALALQQPLDHCLNFAILSLPQQLLLISKKGPPVAVPQGPPDPPLRARVLVLNRHPLSLLKRRRLGQIKLSHRRQREVVNCSLHGLMKHSKLSPAVITKRILQLAMQTRHHRPPDPHACQLNHDLPKPGSPRLCHLGLHLRPLPRPLLCPPLFFGTLGSVAARYTSSGASGPP
mmetsp:Transcript_4398/g.10636  ORF Transcript_4398/g.10636 Transcript_4398/m.10636 type:complete len:256 (-) Transcript_4398:245-1012(-)